MLRNAKQILIALAPVSFACEGSAQGVQQTLGITANVQSTCKVGGTSTPAALNTTIPITPAGQVVTATQTFFVPNVFCTLPTSVLATSMSGGVKSATGASPGFTNIINYSAVARNGLAQSTVNTATIPAAAGPESGNPGHTLLPWIGTLRIDMTPAASALPLVGGANYSDVLRISLTPE